LAEAIQQQNAASMLSLVEQLMQAGKSPDKCLENLMYYFRDLLVLKLAGDSTTERIVDTEKFRKMAEGYTPEKLFKMIETLNHFQQELKSAAQPQTLLEVALLKLCADSSTPSVASDVSSSEVAELRQQVKQL